MTTLPTLVGMGVGNNGTTGDVTYAWPVGYTPTPDDVAVLHLEAGPTIGLSPPTGWAHVPNSPRAQGSNVTSLSVIIRRLDGTESGSGVVVPGSSFNHQAGFVSVWRGVRTTGNPYDTGGRAVNSALSTNFLVSGTATTEDNCQVLVSYSQALDQTGSAFVSFSAPSLGSPGVRQFYGTTTGNGGGVGLYSGTRVAAGTTGNVSATVTSTQWAGIMIALVPEPDFVEPESNGPGFPI
jgi:hypothetical protein